MQITALANIAFVCVFILIVVAAGIRWIIPGRPPLPGAPLEGSHLRLPEKIPYEANAETLLVVVGSNCAPCVSQVPVFRELERNYLGRPRLGFAYLLADAPGPGREFLVRHGLAGPAYFSQDLQAAGIRGMPMIAVADRTGAIRLAFFGAPSALRKAELARLLAEID